MNKLWKTVIQWRGVWMAVSLAVLTFFIYQVFFPPLKFDKATWLECRTNPTKPGPMAYEVREKYVPVLLRNWIKRGDSHAYIHSLLGPPDNCRTYDDSGKPVRCDDYLVGVDWIDPKFLQINYDKEDRVTEAFVHVID